MHDILANPGVIFGITGLCGLAIAGMGYGIVRLAQKLGWLE